MQTEALCVTYGNSQQTLVMTDDLLLAFAKAGESFAYAELCARHRRMAERMVFRIVRSREDTEDILQEAILKAYQNLHGFDGRCKFSTWFARIAVNTALMLLRRRKSRPSLSLDTIMEQGWNDERQPAGIRQSPEQTVIQANLICTMRQAIRQLPPSLREVVELRRRSEVSLAEIAEQAGLTVATTKSRLFRARKVLAIKMGAGSA